MAFYRCVPFERISDDLPAGYMRCKYLESNGNDDNGDQRCKIYTDIVCNCNEYLRVRLKTKVVKKWNKEISWFGSKNLSTNQGTTLYSGSSFYSMWSGINTSSYPGNMEWSQTEVQDVVATYYYPSGRHLSVNEIENTDSTVNKQLRSYSKFAIFSDTCDGASKYADSFLKIYGISFEIDGDVLGRFIPCLDPNGTPCMYDTVSRKAYYNTGTGKFGYELMDGTYVAPI